jgi:hypothetical protein
MSQCQLSVAMALSIDPTAIAVGGGVSSFLESARDSVAQSLDVSTTLLTNVTIAIDGVTHVLPRNDSRRRQLSGGSGGGGGGVRQDALLSFIVDSDAGLPTQSTLAALSNSSLLVGLSGTEIISAASIARVPGAFLLPVQCLSGFLACV